ncbi:hypothetical protein PR048_006028 [Dryococelus australis]|uniref:Uncharacterized protein n=1 Tax=Dryococelus australis TaxID=614101 RepID=A0ABQ9I9T9_9NEOP|nr:hypothetical protein PR048_006028 [Dryococelus australis]
MLLAGALLLLATNADCRRVRVRPQQLDEDQDSQSEQAQYYTQPQPQTVDLLPDPYNGLYGRPATRGQTDTEYRPRVSAINRAKEPPKQPPVATIRNYSKVNDDGSFTFGYEAADGSFKEETRGTDCVVRGKYGYVDPDGNKREFTYVSGNPCDPNSVNEEDESKEEPDDSGEENVPKGPFRPLRPIRPTQAPLPRPTTTFFQEDFSQDEETVDDAPQQVHQTQQVYRTQTANAYQQVTRPTVLNYPTNYVEQDTQRPVVRHQPAVRITPRPPVSATTIRTQLPATTYRPQLVPVTATPRPGIVYSKQPAAATPAIDFDDELRKFQLEHNVATTPRVASLRPQHQPEQSAAKSQGAEPVYETQLVYDPATGQYNTVLYQQLSPKSTAGFNVNHRLQSYVQQPGGYNQLYAQQQQAALLQRSQELYAQQQQQRAVEQQQQQQQHRFQHKVTSTPRYPAYQQDSQGGFYYVQPQAAADHGSSLAHGQIESFLRGHNLSF